MQKETQAAWQDRLSQLAADFAAGHAAVNPVDNMVAARRRFLISGSETDVWQYIRYPIKRAKTGHPIENPSAIKPNTFASLL